MLGPLDINAKATRTACNTSLDSSDRQLGTETHRQSPESLSTAYQTPYNMDRHLL
jgi:hypothetical protein